MQLRIQISGLELWTHIGVSDEERAKEQRILVDITLECEGAAGQTDDVKDTVHYEEVYLSVRKLAKTERKTLEKFAEDIAEVVLKFEKVKSAEVTLKKFVLLGTKDISLTIKRP